MQGVNEPIFFFLLSNFSFPSIVESGADKEASDRKEGSDEKINNIMVSQINRGEDEATNKGEEAIEEKPFIAVGQE